MFVNIGLPIKNFRMTEKCIKGICKRCSDLHINSGRSVVQIPKMFQYHVCNFRCKCIMFVGVYIKYEMTFSLQGNYLLI